MSQFCTHPKMGGDARRDYCPDCKYEFYYGDAHAADPEARISKLVNPGRDRRALGYSDPEPEYKTRADDWEDYYYGQGGRDTDEY